MDPSEFKSVTFSTLIKAYNKLQSNVVSQVRNLASNISSVTPGKFLLVQFAMSQVTQVGESISNMIYLLYQKMNINILIKTLSKFLKKNLNFWAM